MNVDIKKYLKKLIAMGALSFALVTTGCSSKENNAEPENEVTTEVEKNSEQENTTNDNAVQETENNNEDTNTKEANEDNEMVKYFENKNEEIDSLIYTESFEKANEVWGDYFIDAIDFIFYDKEYKDTKFADLNPEAQTKCIDELINTKNKIESINPNWKEDMENIKGSIIEAYYKLLSAIESLIGTENYDNIGDLIDSISNIGNNIGDSLNNWYQGYKSSHQK